MIKFALSFLLIALATCNAQKKSGDETRLTLIVGDRYSGVEKAEAMIIKDAKSLQKFYSIINRTRKPGLPVPDVDFSKETVVVYCSGITEDGTMPYLYVTDETAEKIVLGVEKVVKDANFSALTMPFCIYRVSVGDKIVSVVEG